MKKKSNFTINIKNLETNTNFKLKKYQSSFINIVSQTAQATRPKVVGKMSELVRSFKNSMIKKDMKLNIENWKKYYLSKYPNAIKISREKIQKSYEKQIENIKKISHEDIKNWVENLIFEKTINGLVIEEQIFNYLKNNFKQFSWRKSTSKEESKNIDIIFNDEKIQVKPISAFKTTNINKILEEIKNNNIKIIVYKINEKNQLVEVFFDSNLEKKLLEK